MSGKDDQKFCPGDSGVSARSPRKHPLSRLQAGFPAGVFRTGLPSRPAWASRGLGTLSRPPQVFCVTLRYTNKRKQRPPPETLWVSRPPSLSRIQVPPKDVLCARRCVPEQRRHVQKALLRETRHFLEHTLRRPQSTVCYPSASLLFLCLPAVQHASAELKPAGKGWKRQRPLENHAGVERGA